MKKLNVTKIKKDFPILKRKINGKKLIYLDNVATTQKPLSVINAVSNYYKTSNANIHRGAYTLSQESSEIYEDTKKIVANFIGATNWQEIVYTRNATESINLVASSLLKSKILQKGDTILTSRMEHHSNLLPWTQLKSEGINTEFIELTKNGELDYSNFEEKLKKFKPKLVAITHISNVLGTINNVEFIIKKAHEYRALVLIDGAQSAPHKKINVSKMDVDFYAFSAHKMLGPFGIGVLYSKKELLEKLEPFILGGDMVDQVEYDRASWNSIPWKFEAGTANVAGAIGLASAIKYLEKLGLENIETHENELIKYAITELEKIGCIIYGPSAEKRAGLVAFSLDSIDPHDISSMLDLEGICVRSGMHCAQPLAEYMGAKNGTARIGVYIYNTKKDIDKLIKSLKKIKKIFNKK